MTTALTTTERKTLAKLGRDVTKEHRLFLKGLNGALEHANLCGAFLQQAKDAMPHGHWLKWLETDFPEGSESTAQGYMKIARNWAIVQQIPNDAGDLSIRSVLKFLAKPREPALLEAPESLGNEPAATSLVPSQDEPCPNCGSHEFDDDGDCLECREPGVGPPEPSQDALDEEADESPDSPEEAAEQAGASPCKAFLAFWAHLEAQIDGWLEQCPGDGKKLAIELEKKGLAIRSEP